MGIRVAGDKEGKRDEAGDGVGDEGGVQQREQWLWQQEQWQQAIDGDKGDGDGDGDNVGDGDGLLASSTTPTNVHSMQSM
jgi:hypothetical protein